MARVPRQNLFEKQHDVLERIFKHLLETGRKDLVDAYNDITNPYITATYPKAQKKWKCLNCKKPINPGDKYRCETTSDKGTFFSKRYCLNCAKPERKNIEKDVRNKKMKFVQGDNDERS